MFRKACHICLFAVCLFGLFCWINPQNRNKPDKGPSPALTPGQELSSFQLEKGLKIQLVASEPMVQDPVVTTFDADGRLWVVEMRGFMPAIDGSGENEPVGRVSVLEDTSGDGVMDVSRIYLDSLVMPRAIALVWGGALVAENGSLWLTQDLNNDLKADTKILIDSNYAGSPLPEHSGNGLWRGMDNWYYNAKSRFRYRLQNGKWQRDSTEFRGQWGICHDDEGRLIYNYNWSQLHADLVPPNYLSRNRNHKPTTGIDHGLTVDRRVYPIRPNPAVNRGYIPGTLDKEGRLLEFTAACSPLFYRGTALSKEYYGNVFVCEPAGNLIKRNIVDQDGFMLSAHDPHPGKEFLASTDERFRPVHLSTGPDGALYVTDMYRGVLQHAAYITPYLRDQSIKRQLVQPVHRGRIWRIVPQNWQPKKPKKFANASEEELLGYLSDPDGWRRDMAQRLLVERNDKTIGPALANLVLKGENNLGRFQALWTLDGLKLVQPDLLFQLLSDHNSLVASTAIRMLEPFARDDRNVRIRLEKSLIQGWQKASPEQVLQIALSAQPLDGQVSNRLLAGIVQRYGRFPLIRDAVMSSIQDREFAFLQHLWKSPQWQMLEPDKEIFMEMLATAIIRKKDSGELEKLLAILDEKKGKIDWRQKAVLTGLSMGGANNRSNAIRLEAAPAILMRSGSKLEAGRLAALNSLFEWPGHTTGKSISTRKSILNDEQQQLFALGRQHFLTTCAGCHGTDGAGMKRFAPPLAGSDWVLGDERRLALIVLHGMEGKVQVAGRVYDAPEILPVMPAHSTMDDATITAILTYIRNEWGNNAGPVDKRTVGTTRNTSQGRVVPWKAEELKKYVVQMKIPESK
jgi:mono/diheme cytochrome c family protein/glucose/arabinose dehydrogenase